MRRTKYTREVLEPIVAKSRSYNEVLTRLGLSHTGGNHRLISARIRQAQLDTSHFPYGRRVAWCDSVSVDELAEAVKQSRSFAQVLVRFDMPVDGRPHRELTKRVRELGLDTGHFHGPAWARGQTRDTHPSVDASTRKRELPNEIVFVANGPYLAGPSLTRRLLRLGWDYRCAWCGVVEWRGTRLVLHLDHINEINNDNRLENLRLLCPNCHSQTETYCNRAREGGACYMLVPTRACWNW